MRGFQPAFFRMNELIIPCIQQTKKYRMDNMALKYVYQTESYLKDIISPFLYKLSKKHTNLTYREIEISNLLKHGKTSKEIAALLNITSKGVEFHRNNIRSKLGIKNTGISLRAYLLKLDL